jgi:hypothetical protein
MVRFSWKQMFPTPVEVPDVLPDVPADSSTGTSTELLTVDTSTGSSTESDTVVTEQGSSTIPIGDESGTSTLDSDSENNSSTSSLPVDDAVPTEASTTNASTTDVSSPNPENTAESETMSPQTPPEETPVLNEVPPESPPADPAPESTPVPAAETVSWWPFLMPAYALAEELATGTLALPVTDTPVLAPEVLPIADVSDSTTSTSTVAIPEITQSSSTATTTTPEGAQFVVQYTLDGIVWRILGYVTTVDTDVRLEFPKDILPTLSDISRMKISITPVLQIDTIQPVFLDAVWLEVSYAPLGELGVHGISDIVPSVTPFDMLISDTSASGTATTSLPHMTTTEFVNAITAVHGIDERYVLVDVSVGTSTVEVWLFDMTDHLVHRIGRDNAQIGTMSAGVKEKMIFWLNAAGDTIYTYDLRTAGSLHEMILVGNLPTDNEPVLTFPFTGWQVIWRGDKFYFWTRKTGEVFQDENTNSARTFFTYFNLTTTLPYDQLQTIGGTFVTEADVTFGSMSTSSVTTTESMSTALEATSTESTGTGESVTSGTSSSTPPNSL